MISTDTFAILFLVVAVAILAGAIVWALLDARESKQAKRTARPAEPHKQAGKVQTH